MRDRRVTRERGTYDSGTMTVFAEKNDMTTVTFKRVGVSPTITKSRVAKGKKVTNRSHRREGVKRKATVVGGRGLTQKRSDQTE